MRAVPAFRRAVRVHFVETSAELQTRQRETLSGISDVMLRWHATLAEVPAGPAIILANEFFDALPIHQVERRETGWHLRAVTLNAGGEFALTIADEPLADFEQHLPAALRRAPVGTIFEWRPDDFAIELARKTVDLGAALVIDYGHAKSAPGDTFQAVRSHRYASPLALPGLTDLTAHVDFEALARAAHGAGARVDGPVDQGTFLRRLGIDERTAVLTENAAEEKRPAIAAARRRLIGNGPNDMGTLFKAIGIASPQIELLPGFTE
jgi:SAM-dependent MidA family methyltransferase